jgi:hypothetical protein
MRALSTLALAVVLPAVALVGASDVKAAPVVVAKTDNLNHSQTNSAFFTLSADGSVALEAEGGWAPIVPTQAAAATTTSTTPKKSFSIPGSSTAAGNWVDGNGIPAGITLAFDAEFTISGLPEGSVLTNPGASGSALGRGIGVTQVVGGINDINTGHGLHFSPVAVSNVSFTGSLSEPGYAFTPGGVSGFGTVLFRSNNFDESGTGVDGMVLTQGADTIGFGSGTGSLASNLIVDNNFGPFQGTPGTSSTFPRQSGPYTLLVTESVSVIKGMTLQYDVTYDITPSTDVDADFDGDGDVDGADFLAWQQNVGTTSGAAAEQGDADGNGAVDGFDLAAWQGSFGAGAALPATAAIPEPAAAMLAAIGLLVAATLKRKGAGL